MAAADPDLSSALHGGIPPADRRSTVRPPDLALGCRGSPSVPPQGADRAGVRDRQVLGFSGRAVEACMEGRMGDFEWMAPKWDGMVGRWWGKRGGGGGSCVQCDDGGGEGDGGWRISADRAWDSCLAFLLARFVPVNRSRVFERVCGWFCQCPSHPHPVRREGLESDLRSAFSK